MVDTINVHSALSNLKEGKHHEFDRLVTYIGDPKIQDADLAILLQGLKDSILLLSNDAESLISTALNVPWTERSKEIVLEYQSFIVNLISSHPVYLRSCTRMLIRNFMPKGIKPDSVIEPQKQAEDDICFHHVQKLLEIIVNIAPMAPAVIIPQISEMFPYLTKHIYIQECYVRNLFMLTQSIPKQRSKILEIIVDRYMKLDVRSPRDIIVESEAASTEGDLMFELDNMDITEVKEDEQADGVNKDMNHEDAHKLDVLMVLVLKYIHATCHVNEQELNWEATKKLYRELLLVFEKIILPTHASCHVQFVMFYICSFDERLAEGFIDYLWKKVQDPTSQPVFRKTAVAYIASLLARAKYMTLSITQTILELMAAWAHSYTQACTQSKVDASHHGAFYSVCQAIFYIIAFKHRALTDSKNGLQILLGLNLQTLVTSRLNPLKFCLPIIANTFASISRQHQIVFCDTIIERNKRNRLPTEGSQLGNTHLIHNPLDSFFPFDPYLLTRSGKTIKALYSEFEGSPVLDDDDASGSEADMEEEEFYEKQCATSAGSWVTSPKMDLLKYGISPGFKHI